MRRGGAILYPVDGAEFILDERYPEGPRGLRRWLHPTASCVVVPEDDLEVAQGAVEDACQRWGGAMDLILPAASGTGELKAPWLEFVRRLNPPVAHITTLQKHPDSFPAATHLVPGLPARVEPLLAMLVPEMDRRVEKPALAIALPERDNPWWLAYIAALGALPETPGAALLEQGSLVPNLRFEDLMDIDRQVVEQPTASDLLTRIRARSPATPTLATLWHLAPRSAEWWPESGEPRQLPVRYLSSRLGPNIVVVYEGASVPDLCLLWALRAAHGCPGGFPLGVPVGQDVAGAVRDWVREKAFDQPLLSRAEGVLVSLSVSLEALGHLADELPGRWTARSAGAVLQPVQRPGRPSSEVGVFVDGRARVPMVSAGDRQLLNQRPSRFSNYDIDVDFVMTDAPLPPIQSLERELHSAGLSHGGYEMSLRGLDETADLVWPTRWVTLEAAVRDRGLGVRPSRPGRAAMALLQRVGGLDGVDKLASSRVLERLSALSERKGINWFRSKLRALATASAEDSASDVLRRIEDRIDAVLFTASEDEGDDVTLDKIKRDIGELKAAELWLRWAEQAGVLVRGAAMECDRCGARVWRPTRDLAPPITCSACGQEMGSPLPGGTLVFRYRASPQVVAAWEFDSIAHLLTVRWFWRLLEGRRGRTTVFGAHPGVELVRDDGSVAAELDIVLLMADGSLVPGEAKRRGTGLQQSDLTKLDAVTELLDSPWSFVATLDWDSDCPAIWDGARREEPYPRFALTAEHLLEAVPFWESGRDPFAKRTATDEERTAHDTDFAKRITEEPGWRQAMRVPGRLDRESRGK